MMKFNNFASMGEVFGVKPKVRDEKARKCRDCGKTMRHVDNTNVYVCDCGKTALSRPLVNASRFAY